MADPSTPPAPEGQEPPEPEGQEPADDESTETPPEGGGRSYAESYVRQLRREAAAGRNKVSELEERLKEFEDRDKSEVEKLTGRATEAERRAVEAETRLLRYEVATERGLGMDAAAFLTGSTREELELRADELAKLLDEKGRPPAGSFDGGARRPAPPQLAPEEAHQDLILRSLGMEPRRRA